MQSVIKYQFGDIEAAATDINTTAGRINGLLDDLKTGLQPMVASWEGESAQAYNEAQAKWDKAAAELNMILETISKTVRDGNNRMGEINRMAATSWG
ncbi:WXG100 family type VII secretion target [Corynebacterium sp. H130]|uniref:WXG100 family type VII secretion target n=1 Tax=Corynebacterium sp. H130 TaxID=3133444 RepID=UPI00309E1857